MRKAVVKEQVQQVLSYLLRESANIQKENVIEDLERDLLNYKVVEEFLVDLKKEFEGEDEKTSKVAKLRRLEQREKKMEKFMQKFKRVARKSEYERKLLIEEFKRRINGIIC